MSDLRSEFEKWAKCNNLCLDTLADGTYYMSNTYWAFEAWQASRAALKVELPCWSFYDNPQQYRSAAASCLDEAGISYEE
jgi:hypothetical protein